MEQELKLRKWHCIGTLDLQSSFDRGSRPLLNAESLAIPPLDIDDEELTTTANFADERDLGARLTDVTFPLLTYHAMICQHKLNAHRGFASTWVHGDSHNLAVAWRKHQLATLAEFESYTEHLKGICGSQTFVRFILAVAHESLISLHLLIRRPLYKIPTNITLPADDYDVLGAATAVLQSAVFKASTDFEPWAWYSWTKWYALAMALAELCACSTWCSAEWHAWEVAQQSFVNYAQLVADSEKGLLWKPIERLMVKTRIVHQRQQSKAHDMRAGSRQNIAHPVGSTTGREAESITVGLDLDITTEWLPDLESQSTHRSHAQNYMEDFGNIDDGEHIQG